MLTGLNSHDILNPFLGKTYFAPRTNNTLPGQRGKGTQLLHLAFELFATCRDSETDDIKPHQPPVILKHLKHSLLTKNPSNQSQQQKAAITPLPQPANTMAEIHQTTNDSIHTPSEPQHTEEVMEIIHFTNPTYIRTTEGSCFKCPTGSEMVPKWLYFQKLEFRTSSSGKLHVALPQNFVDFIFRSRNARDQIHPEDSTTAKGPGVKREFETLDKIECRDSEESSQVQWNHAPDGFRYVEVPQDCIREDRYQKLKGEARYVPQFEDCFITFMIIPTGGLTRTHKIRELVIRGDDTPEDLVIWYKDENFKIPDGSSRSVYYVVFLALVVGLVARKL
ncbi:hypothetical protein NHQ30_006555 [Ciborinia camelliae]|nr:hypothetical protein NHQ30_006555 [Ciborinia camelliae]